MASGIFFAGTRVLVAARDRGDKHRVKEDAALIPLPLFAARGARWLAGGLIAGLLLIVVLTVADRARIHALEHFEENSAVGDTLYFQIPADLSGSPAVAVTFNGQPLTPATVKKYESRDTKMLRVGRDEGTGLAIYAVRDAPPGERSVRGAKDDGPYFLKVGPGEYIQLRAAAAAP